MNFDVIFDNDGGGRDNFTYNRNGPNRFTEAAIVDDQIQGAQSSYHDTLAGLHGPVSYAEVMFVDPDAAASPAAISDLLGRRRISLWRAPALHGTGWRGERQQGTRVAL